MFIEKAPRIHWRQLFTLKFKPKSQYGGNCSGFVCVAYFYLPAFKLCGAIHHCGGVQNFRNPLTIHYVIYAFLFMIAHKLICL